MLQNYLKIAVRNLRKHKFYSTLNIVGLGIGIAALLYILLYSQHELSYDKYHPNAENIYRIDFNARLGENVVNSANAPAIMGPTLAGECPEIETYCRFRDRGSYLIQYAENHYKERDIIFVDSSFFDMFGIPLVIGDPDAVLAAPNSIVLSESAVAKYFPTEEALGKTLRLDNQNDYQVTGVMADMPSNTHFHYDFLISMSSIEESRNNNWGSFNFNTYVKLLPGADLAAFDQKVANAFRKGFEPVLRDYVGTTWDEFMSAGNYANTEFMPLTDIHLHSDKENELSANSDIRYIRIFSAIGLFILVLAGINFINLATARSVQRAREVGVRKVVGALRLGLVKQFLSESVVISIVALLFAGLLLVFCLAPFNTLTGKEFNMSQVLSPFNVAIAFTIAIATGIAAGAYPAFHLSRFQPVSVLKGGVISNNNKSFFRNTLVTFQFFVTTLLIIGTLVVSQQLHYMQNKKLGYEREQVIILNDAYTLGDQTETFKQRMLDRPDVRYASVTGFLPVPSSRNSSSYFRGKNPSQENAILINNWSVDFDYVKTMGMQVTAGRDFDVAKRTDSTAIVINEELARQLGFEDPIGEFMTGLEGDSGDELVHHEIIGVIEDFHFESLRESISPLALFINRSRGAISMRLQTDNVQGFIADLRKLWNEMAPGQPFEYQFMDERFERMFASERQLGKVVAVFSFLAIFVACMGLLGLATFIAQQRTKEIGIRKVLGASTPNLVYLLCKDFGALILVAFAIAVPLGWYVMNHWLEDFAYATTLGVGVFFSAGGLVLLVAMLSVLYQASRVALINPVDTLKWE